MIDPSSSRAAETDPPATFHRLFFFLSTAQLIEKKVDLDAQDADGWTALMYAVTVGSAASVSALIKAGVKTETKNNDGETAMDLAKANKKRHNLIQIINPTEPLPTVAE